MWQSDHCESDDTENVIYRIYIGNFYMVKKSIKYIIIGYLTVKYFIIRRFKFTSRHSKGREVEYRLKYN